MEEIHKLLEGYSSSELKDIQAIVDMKLQDAYYKEMNDALTMGITPGELKEPQRSEYVMYLKHATDQPAAKQLLEEWYEERSQLERKESMRHTGA